MLRLCSTCDRHVRAHAPCPFCGSDTGHSAPPSTVLLGTRVAAAVAAFAAVGLGACSGSAAMPSYGLPDSPELRDAGRDARFEAGATLLPKNPDVDAADALERDAEADSADDADGHADATSDGADASTD